MPDLKSSVVDQTRFLVARGLLQLPLNWQVKLSGSRPVRVDGQTLHPELQLLLALRERMGATSLSMFSPEKGREAMRREARAFEGPRPWVRRVDELELELEGRTLRARLYHSTKAMAPLLLFFHGGGFVMGDLDTHDTVCRRLCQDAEVHVLSVDYRLAPEFPFPRPVEDACDSFRWAVRNAELLGTRPEWIAVGGDSAGASLATVVGQRAKRECEQAPVAQLLLYPALDRTVRRPSVDLFAEGFFLTRADVEWFAEQYIGNADPLDERASPLLVKDLSGLPPALVVTAGFDPLRDEGEEYAHRLKSARNRVELRRYDRLIHGFANLTGLSPACREAMADVADLFRGLIEENSR